MKTKLILSGLAIYLPLTVGSQAAQILGNTLTWSFSSPVSADIAISPDTISTPTEGSGTLTFNSPGRLVYYTGTRTGEGVGAYGTAETGLVGTLTGINITYTPTLAPGLSYLGYRVTIDQFISAANNPYDGSIGGSGWTRTTVDLDTTPTNGGKWVQDTYTWNTAFSTPLTLSLSNPNGFLVDSIQLTAVPEPIYYQSIAGACLIAGAFWRRSRNKAA